MEVLLVLLVPAALVAGFFLLDYLFGRGRGGGSDGGNDHGGGGRDGGGVW